MISFWVGRAIRHKDDYASIILVDERYSGARIRDKLPGWIRQSGVSTLDQAGCGREIASFFKRFQR